MAADRIVSNPVHTRVIVRGDDGTVDRAIYCKRRRELVSLKTCAECAHAVSISSDPARPDAEVTCWAPDGPARGDLSERATRTSAGELMRRRFACAGPDTSWESLEGLLLDEDVDAVPVLDAEDRPMGIVSKSDLLRRSRDDGAWPDVSARDVMTPLVHTLPEGSPLSFAIALLAIEHVEQIPLVSPDGEVVGLLAARDVVRWLAHQLGYVVDRPGT